MRTILCMTLAAATLAGSLSAVQALPVPSAAAVAGVARDDGLRQEAQYYYDRRYYRGDRYYRGGRYYGRGNGAALGAVGGLAAGALIAGAIANSQANQPLSRTQDPDYIAYCSRKYRSFDPQSGTFLARDGLRYPCE